MSFTETAGNLRKIETGSSYNKDDDADMQNDFNRIFSIGTPARRRSNPRHNRNREPPNLQQHIFQNTLPEASRSGNNCPHVNPSSNCNPQKALADEAWEIYKQFECLPSQHLHYGINHGAYEPGNNHPYTSPEMSPAEDFSRLFDTQSPPNIDDYKDYRSQPSATAAIDAYNLHIFDKTKKRKSGGSGSGK